MVRCFPSSRVDTRRLPAGWGPLPIPGSVSLFQYLPAVLVLVLGVGTQMGCLQVAVGRQQASVTKLPLPRPTLSPEPALGPLTVLGNGVKASG